MKELGTVDVTIEYIKKQFDNHSYIGNDLILLDHFDNFPARVEACKMNCLFVAMCLSGTAEYVVDAKKYTIHKDDMIVLYGGQLVSDYMLSRDCRAMSIIVSEGFLQETMKGIRESSSLFIFARTHPAFHLGQHEVQVFMEYYNMTKRKINDTNNRFQTEIANSLLRAFIYEMVNSIWHNQLESNVLYQTRRKKIFSDFIKLVEQNFKETRKVSWYAEQLCITPKYLSDTVKAISGETPTNWIDHYVCTELRLLLKISSKNIKEIAADMHFPNQSFLGKYFKERTGISPSHYRKS